MGNSSGFAFQVREDPAQVAEQFGRATLGSLAQTFDQGCYIVTEPFHAFPARWCPPTLATKAPADPPQHEYGGGLECDDCGCQSSFSSFDAGSNWHCPDRWCNCSDCAGGC